MFKSPLHSALNTVSKWEDLGRRPKDLLAVADTKQLADEIRRNASENAKFEDHVKTGSMLRNFRVIKTGDKNLPWGISGTQYVKYVNGYDAEARGAGFFDDAVNTALLTIGGEARNLI
jgi:hypothetical protein